MKNKIIFITGGARSGKSSFALREAEKIEGHKAYIATAQALDDEMKERIRKHKDERSDDWDTFEEAFKIPEIIEKTNDKYSVVVLDCLTLWLSNLMMANADINNEIKKFLDALRITHHTSRLFIVSNEVGMGIVPENELARKFRDTAGFLNQMVAAIADEVYLVTAGIPIKIKGE